MTEEKIYTPETISDNPLPGEFPAASLSESQTVSQSTGAYGPASIQNQDYPQPHVARVLLSDNLNTRTKKILASFEFTPSGAIQIGDYTSGQNGDIRISPSGILARNSLGDTTFALDGETGDAIFAGTIEAGTFVAGAVIVGDNNLIMDGANKRFVVNDGTNDRILIGYLKNGF